MTARVTVMAVTLIDARQCAETGYDAQDHGLPVLVSYVKVIGPKLAGRTVVCMPVAANM